MNTIPRAALLPALFLAPCVIFLQFLFLAPLYFPEETLKDWWWAGLHFWRFPALGEALQVLVPLVPLGILLMPERHFTRLMEQFGRLRQWFCSFENRPVPIFLGLFLLLWILRPTSLMFGDAYFYVTDLIPGQALSERGFTISFDSIGVMYIYSAGYRYMAKWFAMDVLVWYNLFGLLCLAAFFVWLYFSRARGWALASLAPLLVLFFGNWSQAAIGPAEHYGQLLLLSLAFAILAVEALRGREPMWKACLAFSIGAFFHLGIAWIFPALVYLLMRRWRAESVRERSFALYAMIFPALLTWILIYHVGFEVSFLADSHAAEGKLIPLLGPDHPYSGEKFHYTTFDPRHLAHIFQEILLMGWPGLIIIFGALPFLKFGRLFRDPVFQFLAVFFAGTLVFNLLWNPDLEFWRDQDLFCIIGLAVCLLGAWLITPDARQAGVELPAAFLPRLVAAALLGGLAWRIPVMLYHSVFSINYFDPLNYGAYWPFAE